MLHQMRTPMLVIAMILLGACGGTTEPAGGQVTPSPEIEQTPTEDETEAPLPGVCADETSSGEFEVIIRTTDNSFDPECLTMLAGQGLEIRNEGLSRHNLTIEGSDVDLDVEPDEVNRTEAIGGAVEPGTHVFFCSFHRSFGMEGEITITEAG